LFEFNGVCAAVAYLPLLPCGTAAESAVVVNLVPDRSGMVLALNVVVMVLLWACSLGGACLLSKMDAVLTSYPAWTVASGGLKP